MHSYGVIRYMHGIESVATSRGASGFSMCPRLLWDNSTVAPPCTQRWHGGGGPAPGLIILRGGGINSSSRRPDPNTPDLTRLLFQADEALRHLHMGVDAHSFDGGTRDCLCNLLRREPQRQIDCHRQKGRPVGGQIEPSLAEATPTVLPA